MEPGEAHRIQGEAVFFDFFRSGASPGAGTHFNDAPPAGRGSESSSQG